MNRKLLTVEASLVLQLDTSFHIGTGRAEGLLDRTVRRTANGDAYVPATALKGALRQTTQRLLAHLNAPRQAMGARDDQLLGQRRRLATITDQPCRAPIPERMCLSEVPCILCRMYGNVFTGRRLIVDDALPMDERSELKALGRFYEELAKDSATHQKQGSDPFALEEVRLEHPIRRSARHESITHVRIDRRTKGASDGGLFTTAYSQAQNFSTRLSGHVQPASVGSPPELPPLEVILLAATLRAFNQVGANASTGHGYGRLVVADNQLKVGGKDVALDTLIDYLNHDDILFADL